MTNPIASPFVTIMPMEAISVVRRLLHYSVDSIGPPFLETHMLIVHLVNIAKS
jgi:hypothetical protein